MLETEDGAFEDNAAEVGYENPAFFRRLFRPFATATDFDRTGGGVRILKARILSP